ncbi:S-layer homology domain-containing protein [Halarsenatibacter silvermanii]|uniref:S-layer homology domain-containing protein n=1 Tax=Halarsenatibacter silvermanii TaxID=321763 RepID=A0A1G9LVQ3_9FIRM|nr:S-layer homology domain-containing protein [Halarsenatibacter silvermanii]SDL66172.1 S-layer homology domain-containing protein [Halarsenatibacter silvermanii]
MRKLVIVLALALVLTAAPVLEAEMVDVEEDHWAYEAIAQLVDAGIIEGYPDGEYRGEENMTRYEMAVIIDRALSDLTYEMEDIEADIETAGEGLTAEQIEQMEFIIESALEEAAPEAPEELTEEQAEEVTAIVANLVDEFEDELAELEADVAGLDQSIATETDYLQAGMDEINANLKEIEGRMDELEQEEDEYVGRLVMELDTIHNRLSPETVSVGTDYQLTFEHAHRLMDGFDFYVEWSPDDTTVHPDVEGDVLRINVGDEVHGLSGMHFSVMRDDITSYGGHTFDYLRRGHLETTFDVSDELDLMLGTDLDYVFDNSTDSLLDESGKMGRLSLDGSVEEAGIDYGIDVSHFEAGAAITDPDDTYPDEDPVIELVNMPDPAAPDEYEFVTAELNFEAAEVVENLDFRTAYYYHDDEGEMEDIPGPADSFEVEEDYDGFELGVSYHLSERYSAHLDYASVSAGIWPFTDGTPDDHPAGDGFLRENVFAGIQGAEAELVRAALDVDDAVGFDHTFKVEYWESDPEIYYGGSVEEGELGEHISGSDYDSSIDDYVFEWQKSRDLAEDTVLELTTTYTDFGEDVLDEDGSIDADDYREIEVGPNGSEEYEGSEDSRLEYEVFLEHELMSW